MLRRESVVSLISVHFKLHAANCFTLQNTLISCSGEPVCWHLWQPKSIIFLRRPRHRLQPWRWLSEFWVRAWKSCRLCSTSWTASAASGWWGGATRECNCVCWWLWEAAGTIEQWGSSGERSGLSWWLWTASGSGGWGWAGSRRGVSHCMVIVVVYGRGGNGVNSNMATDIKQDGDRSWEMMVSNSMLSVDL